MQNTAKNRILWIGFRLDKFISFQLYFFVFIFELEAELLNIQALDIRKEVNL